MFRDEVDILLHPLKSELNWPLGLKDPLDFTQAQADHGLRWSIPSHLLDAIFCCCGMPIIADIADSRQSGTTLFLRKLLVYVVILIYLLCVYMCIVAVLNELTELIEKGFETLQLQRTPHLVLLARNYYE